MQTTPVPDLESLRWRQRVMVIFAADKDDGKLKEQDRIVDSNTQGFAERDIKVFQLIGPDSKNQQLRDKLRVHGPGFAVVLIGKDGYVKLRKAEPVSAEELFRLIDSMPMRREEMKARE